MFKKQSPSRRIVFTIKLMVLIAAVVCYSGCGGGGGQSSSPSPAAPVFTSTAPSSAFEGAAYTYPITATDPNNSAVTYQIVSAPAGASISSNLLTWTPTHSQSRLANNFSIKATNAAGASATQSWTVTPSGTIRGRRMYTFVADAGTTDIPDDTTQYPIAAWVPQPQGGFASITGTGSPNGTYTIPNVPAGSYWLQSGPQNFIWTNTSDPDTGFPVLGRADQAIPTQPTTLGLSLTTSDPWQSGDEVQVYCSNVGAFMPVHLPAGSNGALMNILWQQPLVDASKGDRAWLYQLSTIQTSGVPLLSLTKVWQPDPFTMADGGTVSLFAPLADVPPGQMRTVRANIKGSAFEQLRSSVNPAAVSHATYAYIDVQPGGSSYGRFGSTPDLLIYPNSFGPITADTDLGDIPYGNPFSSAWTPFVEYHHEMVTQRLAPGASTPIQMISRIIVQQLDMPTASEPLQPLVGTVSSPTVNGLNFFGNQSGVGTTPTLSWGPPTVGRANGYRVSIIRLSNNAGVTSASLVALLHTTSTSVIVPPGLLTPSNTYIFFVIATYDSGLDISVTPYRHSFPSGQASSLSGVMTP